MRERIELERPDQARVQALEVEHRDVGEHPGHRVEHGATLNELRLALGVHTRRGEAALAQLGQIQAIERGDARADAVEWHAREQAALHGERHEALALEDVEHEARVFAVVGDQRGGILAVHARDLGGGIRDGSDPLAAAEQLLRDRAEAIVVEAQSVAHERETVEHDTSGHDRARLARESELLLEQHLARDTAELERHAQRPAALRPEPQVEVDDVPARDHVGVDLADPPRGRCEQRALVGVRDRAVADQRDRPDLACARLGLEVDRDDAQRGVHLGGREDGIREVDQPAACRALAFDRDAGAQPRVDQEAVGEAHVALVRGPARSRDAVAQRRHRRGHGRHHAYERLPGEVAQVALGGRRARIAAQQIGVRGADEEVGPEAVVLDQERPSIL